MPAAANPCHPGARVVPGGADAAALLEAVLPRPPVVCGVDGTPSSDAAMVVAAELAAGVRAPLVLLHVARSPAVADEVAPELGRWARRTGVDGWPLVAVGDPATVLAAAAERLGAPLLVVGSRGRGRLAAALGGSVSSALPALAGRPVVVYRPPSTAGATARRSSRAAAWSARTAWMQT